MPCSGLVSLSLLTMKLLNGIRNSLNPHLVFGKENIFMWHVNFYFYSGTFPSQVICYAGTLWISDIRIYLVYPRETCFGEAECVVFAP